MNPLTVTPSLGEFQQNAPEYIERIKSTRDPIAIVIDGETEVVVQDARSYRRMADELERMRLDIALLEGEADIMAGRTRPEGAVFADLEAEHGLPD